ncbi:MAG TPA: MFS transporter, partial [Gemmobacter sp.]|nr:MFS transporter [Gemmobacter sp.]
AGYGLVLAAGAVGGIAAGLVGERAVRLIGPSRLARGALFVSPACYLALALAPTALSFALIFAVLEFSGPLWNIVSVSTRQRLIPDALMGRVNSLYRLLAWGMMPLGTLLAGGLIAGGEAGLGRAAALHLPLLVAAGLALVLALLAWPVLRRGLPRRAA